MSVTLALPVLVAVGIRLKEHVSRERLPPQLAESLRFAAGSTVVLPESVLTLSAGWVESLPLRLKNSREALLPAKSVVFCKPAKAGGFLAVLLNSYAPMSGAASRR